MRIKASTGQVAFIIALAALCSCGPHPAPHKPSAAQAAELDAFTVAFGRPAPYATLDESGDRVTYVPQALVDVAPGVIALISKGEVAERCKACAGALTIDYLKRGGSAGFSRLGSWPGFAGRGHWGQALPWTVRSDIDNGPTLVTREDQKDAGCSATLEELVTLTPKGPVKIATVVTATAFAPEPGDKTGGPSVSGKIVPIVRGQSFAVVLTGSQSSRQVYRRQGDVFASYSGGATGC
jgi:hypothetical protein